MPRKLTSKAAVPQKWERFAEEYLIDLNASRAAVRAGFSRNGSDQRGYELLRDPRTKARIAELMSKRVTKVELSQLMVVQELKDQLSVTLPDIVQWGDGGIVIKDEKDLTPEQRKSLKKLKIKKVVRERTSPDGEVDRTTTYEYEVELHDRMQVVDMAGKHLGMWKDTHVHIHNPSDFQGIPDEKLEDRLKTVRALQVRDSDKPA